MHMRILQQQKKKNTNADDDGIGVGSCKWTSYCDVISLFPYNTR